MAEDKESIFLKRAEFEESIARIEETQARTSQAMEALVAVVKEHVQALGDHPERLARVEQATVGTVEAVHQIGGVVQAIVQARRA